MQIVAVGAVITWENGMYLKGFINDRLFKKTCPLILVAFPYSLLRIKRFIKYLILIIYLLNTLPTHEYRKTHLWIPFF
jgi:hypothetical protein